MPWPTQVKKKIPLPALADDPDFAVVPGHHGYTCGVISLFLGLVALGISFRATSRVIDFLAGFFPIPFSAPHWTTGRLWWLRFGQAQLVAAKPPADDWVWLIDHSVQIGQQKALVILGIRATALPPPGQPLRAQDMVLIDLVPMVTSTREDVARCLEDAATKTRVPRAIVDDHGVDLNGGVQIFQQNHPATVEIYDAKHKAACLLKSRLEKNPRWLAFCAAVGKTRCAIQQTEWGALTPPGPQPKARFMNLKGQLDWAGHVLTLLESAADSWPSWGSRPRLEEKLGWLRDFAEDLSEWRQWQAIVDLTVGFVASEGVHGETAWMLSRGLRPLVRTDAGRGLAAELLRFVREQARRLKPGERLPGSTEVLESCFGKFKELEKGQAKGGLSSLLVGFGTLLGEATLEQVHKAMTAVPTRKVKEWCAKHLGQTLSSKRKEAYAMARAAQQKLTEPLS